MFPYLLHADTAQALPRYSPGNYARTRSSLETPCKEVEGVLLNDCRPAASRGKRKSPVQHSANCLEVLIPSLSKPFRIKTASVQSNVRAKQAIKADGMDGPCMPRVTQLPLERFQKVLEVDHRPIRAGAKVVRME